MNDEQLLRYSRQIMLPEFGIEGQQALRAAHVAIVGLGGLGSPAAIYLAASGVGRLTLIDFDVVEISNLQRQPVHDMDSIGSNKAVSARETLLRLNPETIIEVIDQRLDASTAVALCDDADCIIDGTDNFASRFAINRACVATGTPLVSAAALRYEGQVSVFDLRRDDAACYACLYPGDGSGEENDNCSENGVLAPVVGIMGSMQALEAIKLLSATGSTACNRLLLFDGLTLQWRELRLTRDSRCPVCAHR